MFPHYFTACPPKKLPSGKCFDVRQVYHSFRPTVLQLASFLTHHPDVIDGQSDVLPLPSGTSLAKSATNSQLQLSANDAFARRMRMVYGYVAEIKLPNLLTINFTA